jgi:hypothetical protein
MIKKDKSLEEEIRKDPAKAISKIAESPLKTDKMVVHCKFLLIKMVFRG